jgi:hypothetical protein
VRQKTLIRHTMPVGYLPRLRFLAWKLPILALAVGALLGIVLDRHWAGKQLQGVTTVQPLADFPGGHGVRLRAYDTNGILVADYAASMDDPLSVAFDF